MAWREAPSASAAETITIPGDEAQMARLGAMTEPGAIRRDCRRAFFGQPVSFPTPRPAPNQATSSSNCDIGRSRRSWPDAVALRSQPGTRGASEAELGRLLKPLVHMANGPDRAGQADLAEIDSVLRRWASGERGEKRRGGGEIRGRLVEPAGRPRH